MSTMCVQFPRNTPDNLRARLETFQNETFGTRSIIAVLIELNVNANVTRKFRA